MNRQSTTLLLSDLLRRDVLANWHWASEVKYVKMGGGVGRVDFMSFKAANTRDGATEPVVQQGTFTCYEVKSCMEDYESGHGLNFIGDYNYLVMPMQSVRTTGA